MDTIRLLYNENNFSITYQALNYIYSTQNQYAYKLEGYDTDWNYVGGRNSAFYTNLSPGKYVFHVKGSNNDGVWNEQGRSLTIIVQPLYGGPGMLICFMLLHWLLSVMRFFIM